MNFQAFSRKKTAADLTFNFTPAFTSTPVVLLTPYWKAQNAAVGYVPTLTAINNLEGKVTSDNSADNYFVNVLAIDAGKGTFGGLPAIAGTKIKTSSAVEIELGSPLTSLDPVTLLSSLWIGAVGYIDTLDDNAASEIHVVSNNSAPDGYFTQYLCTDRGLDPDVQVGSVNKTGGGMLRVYFPNSWSSPPLVFLSPWWNDQNAGVGYIETVSNVTADYFELVSGNAAPNYFVNWMAVQPTA